MREKFKKIDLRNLSLDQMEIVFSDLGFSKGRARQVFSWINRPEVHSFSQMIDIKKEVRDRLNEFAFISSLPAEVVEKSTDGTIKFGFG